MTAFKSLQEEIHSVLHSRTALDEVKGNGAWNRVDDETGGSLVAGSLVRFSGKTWPVIGYSRQDKKYFGRNDNGPHPSATVYGSSVSDILPKISKPHPTTEDIAWLEKKAGTGKGGLQEGSNDLEVKVTKIGRDYHARLIDKNGKILDEWACKEKEDIGWISREMLRWQDKMGNSTPQTTAARKRQTGKPVGKVWKVKK